MGNNHSANHLTTDLVDTSMSTRDSIFKVDNINSHGRKHSTAKIQISNEDLCIRQKHRQSLHIPLDTIKRYGLDGSIFILECGRRAPLGQARYAFRCKQARQLVDCLDQRITMISEQLSVHGQEAPPTGISSSTLTNVSSTFNRGRRTQSDRGRSPASMSLSSATSFYRNSEPDLSENYFAFDALRNPDGPSEVDDDDDEPGVTSEMNYMAFSKASPESIESTTEQQPRQQTLASFLIHPQEANRSPSANVTDSAAAAAPPLAASKAYVFIDYDKTTALKDITQERLQQHSRRLEV